MRLILRLFLSFVLMTPTVHAESRDEGLLRQGLETAGRVAGEQLVKGFLDNMIPVTNAAAGAGASAAVGMPASTELGKKGADQTGVTAGGAFLFAISLGFAIDEFGKAKTDKDKGFAASNAAVAGLTLAFPAAGLVTTLVVLVVRLVDGAVSVRHAKEMMEIQTRINKYYEETIKMETDILASEKTKFIFAFDQMKAAHENVQAGSKYLHENCMKAESIDSLDKLDGCLKSTIQVIEEFQRLIDYSQSLIEPTTRILKAAAAFKEMKIDPLNFRITLGENRYRLSEMRTGLAETLKSYGTFVTNLINARAQQEAQKELPKFFKRECLSKSRRLNMQAVVVLNPEFFGAPKSQDAQRSSDLHQMRDLMDQFQFSGCSSVPSGDAELDKIYDEMDKMFRSTYDNIVKAGE